MSVSFILSIFISKQERLFVIFLVKWASTVVNIALRLLKDEIHSCSTEKHTTMNVFVVQTVTIFFLHFHATYLELGPPF